MQHILMWYSHSEHHRLKLALWIFLRYGRRGTGGSLPGSGDTQEPGGQRPRPTHSVEYAERGRSRWTRLKERWGRCSSFWQA
jgi:hypothetical protein